MSKYNQPDYSQPAFESRRPQQQPYMQGMPSMPQGGNFAPRQQVNPMFGGNNGYQSLKQMPGYDDFYSQYQKNLQEFNATNERIKQGMNESDAALSVEKMDALLEQINSGVEVNVQQQGNVPQVINSMKYLCQALANPADWLPPSRADYVEKISKSEGVKQVIDALKRWITIFSQLKG